MIVHPLDSPKQANQGGGLDQDRLQDAPFGSFLTEEERVLREFNQRYAVVRTSTTHILVQNSRWHFSLDTRSSFRTFHENDFFLSSQGKPLNKADFWLKHPQRRTFQRIVFDPSHPGDHQGAFNIFKGFGVDPAPGDCSLFWQHLRDVICAGDADSYRYVRKWMASVVQKPRLLATALVLRGLQGTGKNRFVEHFGGLFGPYFLTVNSLMHLAGRFNNHLKYAYLIHANEATWSGNRKDAGILKALITDPIILLEGKGQDALQVDNCRHLIVSSNEDHPVPMDLDDRRFFVLNVSAHRKEDHLYFQRLEHQMSQGGQQALLHELMQEDLSSFDPRLMPINDGGFDIKLRSADSCERYLFAALDEGRFNLVTERSGAWEPLPCEFLYQHYRDWCAREGLPFAPSSELGKTLVRILKVEKNRPSFNGVRVWWYQIPALETARERFQRYCKQSSGIWQRDSVDVQDVQGLY